MTLQETDAGLLTIISYPGFAIDDADLVDRTRDYIVEKLQVLQITAYRTISVQYSALSLFA